MTTEEDYEKNLRDYVISTCYTHELIMCETMRLADERNMMEGKKMDKKLIKERRKILKDTGEHLIMLSKKLNRNSIQRRQEFRKAKLGNIQK